MEKDSLYMRRALELAELGRGKVSPNPLVGAVIVHEDRIIGEGWHACYGGPHAEPNAIADVAKPELLKESTIYVTLEPCSHWGKTPPCADLLVHHQFKRVVIGAIDTNPLVGGKGIQRLEEAGIEVSVGVLTSEVREQNRRFFTSMEKKRPYVLLKWAQTADGFIARKNYDSKWISNAHSRQLVHQWRSEEDAILVGKNTVQFDNPSLNVRDWSGKDPVRIVLASSLDRTQSYHVLDGSIPTWVFNQELQLESTNIRFIQVTDPRDLGAVLYELYQRKIGSILVEGGSQVLRAFIESNLWDEARIFTGNQLFKEGIPAPMIAGTFVRKEDVMGDNLSVYYNN
jgi:diaminohydroxyphosphoribosylaminopyrimidine deaminase / 5-amino-6-(5-phosphoribosylamino)uracil reductase